MGEMPTRQELVLQFLLALTEANSVQFNQQSIDRAFALANALADKYLESL